MKKQPKGLEKRKNGQERNIQPIGLEKDTSNTELLSNICKKKKKNSKPYQRKHPINKCTNETDSSSDRKCKWPISMQKEKKNPQHSQLSEKCKLSQH